MLLPERRRFSIIEVLIAMSVALCHGEHAHAGQQSAGEVCA
jgi:hypothetical protein